MLVGLGLGAAWLLRSNRSSPPVFREQHDDTVLPSPGTRLLPRAACRLEWSAGPEGTRYDLTVSDGNLEILAAVKGLTRPEFTLPQDAIPRSTAELFWRVTARLPDGRTLSSETFTSAIEDRAPTSER